MPIRSPAELQGATATLLLTLAARAGASGAIDDAAPPAFSDPEAGRIAAEMALDLATYAADAAFVRGVVLRAALIDRFAAAFFAAHPHGLGVTLGAGLCTRRSRLGAHTGAGWLNVDLPDAIRLREAHVRPGYEERNLACSVLDPAWLDAVAWHGERPVLLMLEGVCPYLPQAPLEAMLRRIAERFGQRSATCVLVMDYVHPILARMPVQVGGMQLPVVSGFEDSSRVAAIHPSIRVRSEDHLYARFSEQHRLFETAFQATTGQWPYTVARFAMGAAHDA